MLKQSTFTFSVPRPSSMSGESQNFQNVATTSFNPVGDSSQHASSSSSPPSTSASKPDTPHAPNSLDGPSTFPADIDFGSLTPFDSSMMNMLDDNNANGQEPMLYDFGGFGQGVPSTQTAYKTIASNPQYMSFVDPAPDNNATLGSINKTSSSGSSNSSQSPFDFFNWSSPARSQTGSSAHSNGGGSLDELFGGNLFGQAQSPVDFTVLMKSPSPLSVSPVMHRSPQSACATTPSSAAGNSPPTDKLSHESPSSCGSDGCPKTKAELEKHISNAGSSMFAPPAPADPPAVRKSTLPDTGAPMIMCKGATFPPTEVSDDNIEVLSAWRSITSHPKFKTSVRPFLCLRSRIGLTPYSSRKWISMSFAQTSRVKHDATGRRSFWINRASMRSWRSCRGSSRHRVIRTFTRAFARACSAHVFTLSHVTLYPLMLLPHIFCAPFYRFRLGCGSSLASFMSIIVSAWWVNVAIQPLATIVLVGSRGAVRS